MTGKYAALSLKYFYEAYWVLLYCLIEVNVSLIYFSNMGQARHLSIMIEKAENKSGCFFLLKIITEKFNFTPF